jgi:hypothetical protein
VTVLGWVAVAVLGAAIVWLGLALMGAVRELEALRGRLDLLERGTVHLADGLPVGSPAPPWEIVTREGVVVSSATFEGRRHVLVFADAGCGACDDLVPAVVRATDVGSLPPSVVLDRADAGADGAATAFNIEAVPHVVVVDEGGFIVAQGAAAGLDDVRALIEDAAGIRVVAAQGPA